MLENTIKISEETETSIIVAYLKLKCKSLSFTLKNNFLNTGSRLSSTGIGIENLKRRLEVYGLKHELICKKESEIFVIKLKIWNLPTAAL